MAEELLEFACETALAAGEIVKGKFGKIRTWKTKEGRGDIVTEADTESEDFILGRIRAAYPEHGIVAEESGTSAGAEGESTWYVDPLDGTNNYARGVPFFAVNIAVAMGNDVLAGVTYDPLREEMFRASAGSGAFLNEKRLVLESDAELEDAVISLSWSRRRLGSDRYTTYIERLEPYTSHFRRHGSASLAIAYVAAGRLDAYIEGMITPWDIATGVLLVAEAGGKATDYQGKQIDLSAQRSDVVAANEGLHGRLVEEILR